MKNPFDAVRRRSMNSLASRTTRRRCWRLNVLCLYAPWLYWQSKLVYFMQAFPPQGARIELYRCNENSSYNVFLQILYLITQPVIMYVMHVCSTLYFIGFIGRFSEGWVMGPPDHYCLGPQQTLESPLPHFNSNNVTIGSTSTASLTEHTVF